MGSAVTKVKVAQSATTPVKPSNNSAQVQLPSLKTAFKVLFNPYNCRKLWDHLLVQEVAV